LEARGTLGSWTLDDRGSDSPWLPATALSGQDVPLLAAISVHLDGATAVGAWSARASPATDSLGESGIGLGGREEAEPPLQAVTLDRLPPGRWVVAVRLDRADGRGDATFYWLLTVG
jgi:hypothetical protein